MTSFSKIVALVLIGIFSLVHLVFIGHMYIFSISSFFRAAKQLAILCLGQLSA